jgi:hypothetical protein
VIPKQRLINPPGAAPATTDSAAPITAVCDALRDHIANHKLDRADLLFPFALLDANTGRTSADTTDMATSAHWLCARSRRALTRPDA